jgi:hypothetical protein
MDIEDVPADCTDRAAYMDDEAMRKRLQRIAPRPGSRSAELVLGGDGGATLRLSDALDLFAPPEWHRFAACRGMRFFHECEREAEALAVCSRCPVTSECLADHGHEVQGVVGGKRPAERAALRVDHLEQVAA